MVQSAARRSSLMLVPLLCLASSHGLAELPAAEAELAASTEIPSIEAMASEWLDVAQITHLPSLHNFHDMAACAPDLLAVNYLPGRRLFVYPVTTRWYEYYSLPRLKFRVNGHSYESTTCRWFPYQAVRRRELGSLQVETAVRMVFEGPGLLYQVEVTNTS